MVYMDYENIQELLRKSGKTPQDIDFFPVILDKFKKDGMKVIDFLVYGNFEKSAGGSKQQTYLRTLGLQTRQASSCGKNASGLELTVDALRSLYKTPGVDLYILITSDRDIIPLLKAIRLEMKLSSVLSTRHGFNPIVAGYADFHEYLEDIFSLSDPVPIEPIPVETAPVFDPENLTPADVERAREAARRFYTSHIWRRAVQTNEAINLSGYIQALAKAINLFPQDLLNDFKLAHCLKFVTICEGPDQRLLLKEGPKKAEFIKP
jgi:hypothetical protein